jgi:phosphatidylglycerophosphate synthase
MNDERKEEPMNTARSPKEGKMTGFDACVDAVVNLKKHSAFLRRTVDRLPRWVTPNAVTIFRTVLIVPAVWLLVEARYLPALLIFGLAALLDFVDGALAEIRNIKTVFGAFLDPLSDKVLVCGFMIAVLPRLPWPFIPLTALVVFGAVGITVTRIVKLATVRRVDQRVIAAKPAGKIKMISEVASVIIVIGFGLGLGWTAALWVGSATLLLGGVLGLMSFKSQIDE